jgi:inositol phosphorylceramide mannosyltransferase catalytic subunit
MIPRVIHQTWKTDKVPEVWVDSVNACKDTHKSYKYMLWTDVKMKEFVKKEYPEFYKTYISYPHVIQRCDAFRYLVLYKYGGIYIDMDLWCKKSLTPLLKYDLVLVKSANYDTITNSFIIATQKNPFIKYCIDNLEKHKNSYSIFGKHIHIMNSTGPLFIDKMVKEYGLQKKRDNYYILTKSEFSGDCSVCNTHKDCNGGTYFKHVVGNSWHSLDSKIYNSCLCMYRSVFGIE